MLRDTVRRILLLTLAAVLSLGLVGPPSALAAQTATTIRLEKTEGTVSVKDSAGKSQSVQAGMRLTSGTKISTGAKSYAWIALDDTKAAKLDASSTAEVRRSGKKLEILATSGSLSFNVSKPLESDESLNIRTSTMVTGVRGTFGYLSVVSGDHTSLTVLEGRVECVADGGTVSVGDGETADFFAGSDQALSVSPTDPDDIPGSVLVELAADQALREKIAERSGIDLRDLTMREAQARLTADQAAAAGTASVSTTTSRRSSGGGSGGSAPVRPSDPVKSDGTPDVPDVPVPSDGKPDVPDVPVPSDGKQDVPDVPVPSDGKPDVPDVPVPSDGKPDVPDVPVPSDGKPDVPDVPVPSDGKPDVPDVPVPSDGKPDVPDVPVPSDGKPDVPDVPVPSDGKPDVPDVPVPSDGKPDVPDVPVPSDGKPDVPDVPVPSDGKPDVPDVPVPSDGKPDVPDVPVPSDGKPDVPDVPVPSDGTPDVPDGPGMDWPSWPLTLHTDGGSFGLMELPDRYYEGYGLYLPVLFKDGYTFGGWYASEDLSGDPVYVIGPTETGEKTFYARWIADGEETDPDPDGDHGDDPGLPSDGAWDGWIPSGGDAEGTPSGGGTGSDGGTPSSDGTNGGWWWPWYRYGA